MSVLNAIGKISWGYFFIYLNLNLGTISILPPWVGFLLIYAALDTVAAMEPSAKLLKPFALLLAAEDAVEWGLTIFSITLDFYWIDIFVNVISLYFHFQLLTNLAKIAESQECTSASKLKKLRSVQTILLTIMTLMPVSQRASISLAENGIVIFAAGLISVIVMIAICATLFAFKGELRAIARNRLSPKE